MTKQTTYRVITEEFGNEKLLVDNVAPEDVKAEVEAAGTMYKDVWAEQER